MVRDRSTEYPSSVQSQWRNDCVIGKLCFSDNVYPMYARASCGSKICTAGHPLDDVTTDISWTISYPVRSASKLNSFMFYAWKGLTDINVVLCQTWVINGNFLDWYFMPILLNICIDPQTVLRSWRAAIWRHKGYPVWVCFKDVR